MLPTFAYQFWRGGSWAQTCVQAKFYTHGAESQGSLAHLALGRKDGACAQGAVRRLCVHAGESVSVLKGTEPVPKQDCELQAKDNMLFAGTAISNGICVGCVVSIGMETEIGKIQSQIQVGRRCYFETCLRLCWCRVWCTERALNTAISMPVQFLPDMLSFLRAS